MIKADLQPHLHFLKVSPIRRIPPKDLSTDITWIDGQLKLAKWIQVVSLGLLLDNFMRLHNLICLRVRCNKVVVKAEFRKVKIGTAMKKINCPKN